MTEEIFEALEKVDERVETRIELNSDLEYPRTIRIRLEHVGKVRSRTPRRTSTATKISFVYRDSSWRRKY